MPDYSKIVIYKIQHEDNEELVYVGSTTDFTKRKYSHKERCKINSNKGHLKIYQMIRDNGGWECFRMVQIKEFPCNNKKETEAEEDKVMLELKANMNSIRASRTQKEYYYDDKEKILERNKKYREKNKEELNKISRQYYENNKDEQKKKHKQYYEDNKEELKNFRIQYYKNNKEKINEKISCECGCIVTKAGLLNHKKSKKHIKLLNDTTEQ